MVSTQSKGPKAQAKTLPFTLDGGLTPLFGGGGLGRKVSYGVVRQLATAWLVLSPGVGELFGGGAEGSRVWLPWGSGCLPGSVCSLAHLVLFILISCRHTAMSNHLINRVASIHGALVHAWETLYSPRLGSLPFRGASVRSPGPSHCPCSSESQVASAATATTRGGGVFISLERGKDSVVSGLEQCPRYGGDFPEGSHKLLLWSLPIGLQEG